jgi:hypothetical protein
MENKRIPIVQTDEILIKHNHAFLDIDEYINHINVVTIKKPIIMNTTVDNQNNLSLTIKQTQSTIQIPDIYIYNKSTKEYIKDGIYISHEKNINLSTEDYSIIDFIFDMGNDFDGEKDFNVVFT